MEEEKDKINLDLNLDFESIIPWNGQQDSGRDVRLKLDRNWQRVVDAFHKLSEFMVTGEYMDKRYLRKDKEDVAQEIITFLKGIVTDILQSSDFSSGELGSGFVIKNEGDSSYMEIDRLLVRRVAYFVELIIKSLKHVGGTIVLTPASMRCSRVEEFEAFYRCFFENERDGKMINQEFVAGDQARSQTFNVKEGVSHNVSSQFYWRLVIEVGEDYIDLSKSDAAVGSMPPLAGDDIVQLGNRDDATRQNAIILSTVGDDAPSIKQYKGICDYSLSGREVIVISPVNNMFTGRFKSSSSDKDLDAILDEFGTNLSKIKAQTDQEYTIWFFDYEPTFENKPAVDWDEKDMVDHEYDMFYNQSEGLAWRFMKGDDGKFYWKPITDQQTIAALEKAAKAQKTADLVTAALNEIVSDGVLSSLEKKEVLKEWETIFAEYPNNIASVQKFELVSNELAVAYISSYKALGTYMNGGDEWNETDTPAWLADLSVNQPIDAEEYRGKWMSYYNAERALLNLLSETAKKKADNAQEEAEDARKEADKANNSISEIVSDGVLSSLEKKEVLREWEELVSAYTKNMVNASSYNVDSKAYTSAYNALGTYLNGGEEWDSSKTPSWLASLDTNQVIESSVYRSKWTGYYDAEIVLLDAISKAIRKEAVAAQIAADKAQETADEKSRNFVIQPTPPYKIGDRWSKAVYPASGDDKGSTYDNDDLVCVKSKVAGEEFEITDWEPASALDSNLKKIFYSELERLDESISLIVGSGETRDKAIAVAKAAADEANTAAGAAQKTADAAALQASKNATAIVQTDKAISLVAAAFETNDDGSLKLDDDGKPILTKSAGAVITDDMAGLYATKTTVDNLGTRITKAEASIKANADNIELKVSKDGVISSINQSAEKITIKAEKIDLEGKVTFSMLNSDTQNNINGKASPSDIDSKITAFEKTLGSLAKKDKIGTALLDETIIAGGYLKTALIDVDSLVAKHLTATNSTGEILDISSKGIIIKDKSGNERLNIYGADSFAHILVGQGGGINTLIQRNSISCNGESTFSSFSNKGVYLGNEGSIRQFALGNIGSSITIDSDFFIAGGGTYTLPSANGHKGKVIFVKLTKASTLRSLSPIYKANEYSTISKDDDGYYSDSYAARSMFFISNGANWYEFSSWYR